MKIWATLRRRVPEEPRPGFEVQLYGLTPRTFLAILLNQTNLDKFVETADEADVIAILGAFSSSPDLDL